MNRPLGRLYPKHFDHVEAYPIIETPTIQPVAPGVNWYTSFDSPTKESSGRFILKAKNLGTIRGGHCFCMVPPRMLSKDTDLFYKFFDQKLEGACEGFGHARRFSILTGQLTDAFHLYDDARKIEETYPGGEGTSNDATCQALKKWGLHMQTGTLAHRINVANEPVVERATAYRWATTVDQIWAALGITDGSPAPFVNSWGVYYPHVTYMPPETMARLLRGGECDVLTDR